jgi:hypothetical protein
MMFCKLAGLSFRTSPCWLGWLGALLGILVPSADPSGKTNEGCRGLLRAWILITRR